MLLTAIAANGL